MSERELCKQFVQDLEADNKPAALKSLTKCVEAKIQKRIEAKKNAFMAEKKW